jgi:hypothetical protein
VNVGENSDEIRNIVLAASQVQSWGLKDCESGRQPGKLDIGGQRIAHREAEVHARMQIRARIVDSLPGSWRHH